jgi:hypothetical protein
MGKLKTIVVSAWRQRVRKYHDNNLLLLSSSWEEAGPVGWSESSGPRKKRVLLDSLMRGV